MPSPQETYASIRSFVNFTDHDVANLVAIRPIIEKHGPAVTDEFYEVIQRTPATARFVEGRVEALKKTHTRWMMDLVGGDYGDAYHYCPRPTSRVVLDRLRSVGRGAHTAGSSTGSGVGIAHGHGGPVSP